MSKPRYIQIQNGELTAEVPVSALKAWERNGWTAVDDESSEVPPNQAQEQSPVVPLAPQNPPSSSPLPDKTKE